MRIFFLIFIIILLTNCSKPKTVLICGDHVCVNKLEAKQYFEENLSIEVKIIDNKSKKEIDLVELNLTKDSLGKKEILISEKINTNKKIKTLSNEEINIIKENIKKNKNIKKIAKKKVKIEKTNKENNINISKKRRDIVDVCKIIKKCNIDEISKYLIKQGKSKDFPDITSRQ